MSDATDSSAGRRAELMCLIDSELRFLDEEAKREDWTPRACVVALAALLLLLVSQPDSARLSLDQVLLGSLSLWLLYSLVRRARRAAHARADRLLGGHGLAPRRRIPRRLAARRGGAARPTEQPCRLRAPSAARARGTRRPPVALTLADARRHAAAQARRERPIGPWPAEGLRGAADCAPRRGSAPAHGREPARRREPAARAPAGDPGTRRRANAKAARVPRRRPPRGALRARGRHRDAVGRATRVAAGRPRPRQSRRPRSPRAHRGAQGRTC